MIGMPASFALASEPLIASAFGTETARPSTFCETAASISCASFCGSLLDGLQMSLTPSSLAACSAPFLTTDQNEPSSLCVTIANVRSLPWVRLTACVRRSDDCCVAVVVVAAAAAAATSAPSARTTTSHCRRVASSSGHPLSPRSRCGQELDAPCDIERRTAADRWLRRR